VPSFEYFCRAVCDLYLNEKSRSVWMKYFVTLEISVSRVKYLWRREDAVVITSPT
jgi:hypothetical protein